MAWTREDQLTFLLRLPWSVTVRTESDGDWTAQVSELPFLVATGADEKQLGKDLFDALWSALDAMLEHGDPLTLPKGVKLPWESGAEPPAKRRWVFASGQLRGGAWEHVLTASSVSESLALSV